MSFFDDEEVRNTSNQHAEELRTFSEEEIARILAKYKEMRVILRDKLDMLPEDTFTAQKTRMVLAQIESTLEEMGQTLKSEMSIFGESGSRLGLEHLLEEIRKWNKVFGSAAVPLSARTMKAVTDANNFLFNKYETSIDAYTASMRSVFANGITQMAIEEVTMSELVQRIAKTFLGEEWKIHRLIRTEVMGVYSLGKLYGMRELAKDQLPDLMKTLWHPMDARTGKDSIRLNRDNPIVPVDEPFVESSLGHEVTYMMPPNRPNDRAIMIPYRESWARDT